MTMIGELNRRVILQDMVRTPDGAGGSEATWNAIAELWAKIRPRHAGEHLVADAVTSAATHMITIRYRNGLTPDMRFVAGSRVFEIVSVIDEKEANCWHMCLCREVLGDAT